MPVFNLNKIQEPTKVEGEEAVVVEPKEETVAKVKVDGPLSNLFTEALQKVLSSESVGADALVAMKMLDNEGDENSDLYVYCCDTDKMDSTGLVNASDGLKIALDSGKYKKVALVTESLLINNKLACLEAFARSVGAQVYYSNSKAVREVLGYRKD